jgi:hypothetical protein
VSLLRGFFRDCVAAQASGYEHQSPPFFEADCLYPRVIIQRTLCLWHFYV